MGMARHTLRPEWVPERCPIMHARVIKLACTQRWPLRILPLSLPLLRKGRHPLLLISSRKRGPEHAPLKPQALRHAQGLGGMDTLLGHGHRRRGVACNGGGYLEGLGDSLVRRHHTADQPDLLVHIKESGMRKEVENPLMVNLKTTIMKA